jgi:hypothetical protein
VTTFFLGGVTDAGRDAQAGYAEFRERSRVATGCPVKQRRIYKLECRWNGSDCEIEVGLPMPDGQGVVAAILDHGREQDYAVCGDGPGRDVVYVPRPVYAVTEFI